LNRRRDGFTAGSVRFLAAASGGRRRQVRWGGRPGEVAVRLRRVLIVVGILVAVAAIAGAGLEFRARNDRLAKLARGRLIDPEHFGRIKMGMSRAEVEVILGGPPGDFNTEPVLYAGAAGTFGHAWTRWEYWYADEGQIRVAFNERATVQFCTYSDGVKATPTLAECIRAWLQRLWP
jgi:hypothetical protein